MADIREAVLARLLEIAQGIDGVVTAARNRKQLSDTERPAILILDADEAAEQGDPDRKPTALRRVGMTPEIYLLLGAKPEAVGTEINNLRALFVRAVMTDSDLIALLGTNGGIRYEGCATGLAMGRTMEGEMGVSFTFLYVLRPDQLTPTAS